MEVGVVIAKQLEEVCITYPIIADKGAEYPFAVYRRTALGENLTKDLRTDGYIEYATVELVIASTKYSDSIRLAQEAKTKLEATKGNIDGVKINDIRMISATENWGNDAYMQIMTYRIEIEK